MLLLYPYCCAHYPSFQGTDVLKALALGARAVFVGRPNLYALAVDGERGVNKMLEILRKEVDVSMALSGCCDVEEVPRDLVLAPKAKY